MVLLYCTYGSTTNHRLTFCVRRYIYISICVYVYMYMYMYVYDYIKISHFGSRFRGGQ